MFKTINSKFIFFTIIFIILSVGIPTYFLIVQFRENFEQRSKIMLETTMNVTQDGIMNIVHSGISAVMMHGEQGRVQHILDKVALNENIEHIRIIDEQGKVLYSSNLEDVGRLINEISPDHIEMPHPTTSSISLINRGSGYSLIEPILNEIPCQKCHGSEPVIAYLDIDSRLTPAERKFYTGSVHILFLAIAVIILLFFGFYFLFNYFINKPLTKFISALEAVKKGDLNTKIPVTKEDEIGVLSRHFNRMMAKLRSSQEEIESLHFEQLQRADKLVTLGELAAEMAHEINNPAGIILSRADYMQFEIKDNPGLNKYDEDLEVIIKQINKVSKITSDILRYSKKLPKHFIQVNIVDIIEESLHILEPRLEKKNISLKNKYAEKEIEIFGDAQQLEQVVTNLVNNAIDAMTDEGELTIFLQKDKNEQVELSISDNGMGISEEVMDQIFSPFFTTKSADKGTGLGLYIVKNICKNHNANIICESEPGIGATFKIIFNQEKN